jgi:hypothetical protein
VYSMVKNFVFCLKNDLIWFDKGYAINAAYYGPFKMNLEKKRKTCIHNFFQDIRGCLMQIGQVNRAC